MLQFLVYKTSGIVIYPALIYEENKFQLTDYMEDFGLLCIYLYICCLVFTHVYMHTSFFFLFFKLFEYTYVLNLFLFSENNSPILELPWWFSGKDSTCSAGDTGEPGLIPGLGRTPGGRHGNPFQYSCLENLMDRGAWQVTVHRVAKSQIWLK